MVSEQKLLRVLVVDDHPVVREGLRAMLSSDSRFAIVEEAGSGEEAIEKASDLEPDVVLVDIRMPGMSGIETTKRLKAMNPDIAIILLTMYDSEVYVVEALRVGAVGYLVKDSSRELLLQAIEAAVSGGTIIRSRLLHQTINGLLRLPQKLEEGQASALANERFTPREFEVLRLVAQGHPNKDIAGELGIAEITVKKYVTTIISKLGVSDRTQVAIVALRMGLVQ